MTKKKSKAKKRKSTALAVRKEMALTTSERSEVAQALDGALGKAGRVRRAQASIAMAMHRAAAILAPHFAVSSAFVDRGEAPEVEDTEILVEILCSAGAWLARSRGVPREELIERFEAWCRDQGYE